MNNKTFRKVLALLLCTLFVLTLIFSYAFIIKEANHECDNEDCHTCELISSCIKTIKKTTTVIIVSSIIFILFNYIYKKVIHLNVLSYFKSPILLKTRLNN